MRLTRD